MLTKFKTVAEPVDVVTEFGPLRATHEASARQSEWQFAQLAPMLAAERDEYRLDLDVDTDQGQVAMSLPLRVSSRVTDKGTRYRVRGTQYQLTLTIDVEPDRSGAIHWRLEQGGKDAAGRAVVIDLLIALSGKGTMTLSDPDFGAVAIGYLRAQPIEESLSQERAFLTDVLAIEAWSERRFALPEEISELDSVRVAETAQIIRAQEYRFRFKGPITLITDWAIDECDELKLGEERVVEIFGIRVPLGNATFAVRVRMLDSEELEGSWSTRFKALDAPLTAKLNPPHGRRSSRNLRLVNAGGLPGRRRPNETKRRRSAMEAAEELVEQYERENGPIPPKLVEEIRHQWPP